jgi:hypothetical protein
VTILIVISQGRTPIPRTPRPQRSVLRPLSVPLGSHPTAVIRRRLSGSRDTCCRCVLSHIALHADSPTRRTCASNFDSRPGRPSRLETLRRTQDPGDIVASLASEAQRARPPGSNAGKPVSSEEADCLFCAGDSLDTSAGEFDEDALACDFTVSGRCPTTERCAY